MVHHHHEDFQRSDLHSIQKKTNNKVFVKAGNISIIPLPRPSFWCCCHLEIWSVTETGWKCTEKINGGYYHAKCQRSQLNSLQGKDNVMFSHYKNIIYLLNSGQHQEKHSVSNLVSGCNNHTKFELYQIRICWEMRWPDNPSRSPKLKWKCSAQNGGYHHARFERSCLCNLRETANVKFVATAWTASYEARRALIILTR